MPLQSKDSTRWSYDDLLYARGKALERDRPMLEKIHDSKEEIMIV
jgi:hypothetical protein